MNNDKKVVVIEDAEGKGIIDAIKSQNPDVIIVGDGRQGAWREGLRGGKLLVPPNTSLSFMSGASVLGLMSWSNPAAYCGILSGMGRKKERVMSKCLLPGCEVMTAHNGGYCCAGHCRDHEKMRKEKK